MSEVSEKVYKGSRYGTFMTVSKVTLMTSASDDGAVIKCRATHPALVPGAVYPHLQDSANLTIYCKSSFYYTNFIAVFLLLKFMFSKKTTRIDGEDFVNFCGLLRKHEL